MLTQQTAYRLLRKFNNFFCTFNGKIDRLPEYNSDLPFFRPVGSSWHYLFQSDNRNRNYRDAKFLLLHPKPLLEWEQAAMLSPLTFREKEQ